MSPGVTIAVVMGVSGSGKTTVGKSLAGRLGWTFQEGDALHPPSNIAKMKAGVALTDADRAPWLHAIAARIDTFVAARQSAVITCSALKRAYRDVLARGHPQVRFVFLTGEVATLEARVAGRRGHFMPASLLASQLDDLEPPAASEHAIAIDIGQDVDAQVSEIIAALETAAPDNVPAGRGRPRP